MINNQAPSKDRLFSIRSYRTSIPHRFFKP
jgi:hypothetical protein